ncbi:N-acetylglucosamine kinase [Pseudomonas syringae]|jgi:glucosamine kinase|uniref:ATPase n=1 Tax=Pseudomonas syringae TaxID=317 RepID=A0A085UV62_PSESX|nr:BadF/BadG/BcrA/BcrD ATPase family protein [Pseudomonas syringae]KFE47075.1 ATPase [Pseudomonas syringae]
MNECILGLDSGGSKTLLAIANRQGQVLKLETANGLDPIANNDWQAQLSALLQSAAELPLVAAVLGLPLHGELSECSIVQHDIAQQSLRCPVTVENDVRIAFDGAFIGASAGVLILAGTGSMAWASRNDPGAQQVRVGGWGDVFGDEGSAYWIGAQALVVASRSLDGRDTQHRLTNALLNHLRLAPEQLAGWVYGLTNRRASIAALALQVSAWADAGDSAAITILDAAAGHLAEHISAAWRAIGQQGSPSWSYAGGVFANPSITARVAGHLGTAPRTPRLPPIGGALWRAAHNAGWNPDNSWIEHLSSSLRSTLALPSTSPFPT